MSAPGRLTGVGLGPGDPELITVKGSQRLAGADVVAYPASAAGERSLAWDIARHFVKEDVIRLPLVYPRTGRDVLSAPDYRACLSAFYDETAAELRQHLLAGRQVALPVLGDPLIYGSFIYWYQRMRGEFQVEIVPGISALTGGASRLGVPLCLQEDMLALIPATLERDGLAQKMLAADAFVVFKLGGQFAKVRDLLHELGLAGRALYIERATMAEEKVMALAEVDPKTNPYFAMILVPTARRAD